MNIGLSWEGTEAGDDRGEIKEEGNNIPLSEEFQGKKKTPFRVQFQEGSEEERSCRLEAMTSGKGGKGTDHNKFVFVQVIWRKEPPGMGGRLMNRNKKKRLIFLRKRET